MEHAVLIFGRKPGIKRKHFGRPVFPTRQRQMGFADFALAGQKHKDIAKAVLHRDLVHRHHDFFGEGQIIGALAGRRFSGTLEVPVADFDRMAAPLHCQHRRAGKMRREACGIDGRRGDDDLEITAAGRQGFQVAEQEIDIQAALVRLIDDQGVVTRQPGITLDLGE